MISSDTIWEWAAAGSRCRHFHQHRQLCLGCEIDLELAGQFSSLTILSDEQDRGRVSRTDLRRNGQPRHRFGAGSVTIENAVGGSGGDTLAGNAAGNTLVGNNGDDTLIGEGGNDRLLGLAGNDVLIGGAGNDSMDGGTGIDLLDYSGSGAAINANLTSGVAENDGQGGVDRPIVAVENVLGTAFNDTISGSAGANELEGTAETMSWPAPRATTRCWAARARTH